MMNGLLRKIWMANLVGLLFQLSMCVSEKVEARYEACAKRIDALLPALGCVLLLVLTPIDSVRAAETSPTEFSLESHDQQTYTHKSRDNKLPVLFLSSREGSEYSQGQAWSRPVADFTSARAGPGEKFDAPLWL